MRVGVFVAMAGRKAGGPESYELALAGALSRAVTPHELRLICLDRQAERALAAEAAGLPCDVLWPRARVVSMAVTLPLHLLLKRVDLLHVTFAPPPVSTRPYVFTHHCFSTFNHPEFYDPWVLLRLNALIERGLRSARIVVCVSENTRDLTAERFGIPLDRTRVVHHGVDPFFRPVEEAAARAQVFAALNIEGPYLLYLGKIDRRKNVVRLLEAFHAFRREAHEPVKLLVVGRPSAPAAAREVEEALDRLGLRGQVAAVGYVPRSLLPALYSAATAFVFPSLWEGFGMPVLEAMACGAPVLTSSVAALPEVAGDAALLVDPHSVQDIAGGMHALHASAVLRADLRARGLRRAREFTWERAARETLRAYADAAGT